MLNKAELAKGVILVPNENTYNLPPLQEFFDDGGYHQESLIKYIFKYGIYNNFNIPNAGQRESYYYIHINEIIYQLVNLDFSIGIYCNLDDTRDLLIYLPPQLGEKQSKDFKNMITELAQTQCYISILNKKEELFDPYYEEAVDIQTLMQLLDEKSSNNQITK